MRPPHVSKLSDLGVLLTSALSLGLTVFSTPRAEAQVQVNLVPRGSARLVLDGLVADCSAVAELMAVDNRSQVVSGASAWSGPDDASFGFVVIQDTDGLWIAAEIRDDTLVRSREHRASDDALILTLAVTHGTRPVLYELSFLPGEPGSYPAAVNYLSTRRGAVPSAQAVEAPLRGAESGIALEARVPWAAIPEVRSSLGTLRARIAWRDNDSGRTDSVISSGQGDARRPEELPPAVGSVGSSGPSNLLQRFTLDHSLGATPPVLDRAANLAGDSAQERVVVFPQYILAYGPGIAGGTNYTFTQLPTSSVSEVLETALRDLTGDSRPELTLKLRVPTSGFTREVFMVYGFDPQGVPVRLFAHETTRSQGSLRLSNRLSFASGGMRFANPTSAGFTAANYPNVTEAGVAPPLTPWGPHRAEVYVWRANAFVLDHSEPNPAAVVPEPQARVVPENVVIPTNDLSGLLRLFRQREGIPEAVQPTFSESADMAEDSRAERVMVFGRTLVVMGPGYAAGRSYYTLQLPLAQGDTVLSLSLVDLTGEGRAEAVLRLRRASTAVVLGRSLAGSRETLVAYTLEPSHRGRIFAAEVQRSVGEFSIANTVSLPQTPRGVLIIQAGRAQGWTAQNYPFHDSPQPGVQSLMLPWESAQSARYQWNGTAFLRLL